MYVLHLSHRRAWFWIDMRIQAAFFEPDMESERLEFVSYDDICNKVDFESYELHVA